MLALAQNPPRAPPRKTQVAVRSSVPFAVVSAFFLFLRFLYSSASVFDDIGALLLRTQRSVRATRRSSRFFEQLGVHSGMSATAMAMLSSH
jgi:hypothetical protein